MLNYPITYRSNKGSALTYEEGDNNFHELDDRTELGWRDNIVQLDIQPGNPNSASLNIFRGGIRAYNFFGGQMTEAFAAFHIDHDYALNTNIYPHCHWAIQSNEIGVVRWGIEYTIAKGHGQEAFGPTQTIYIETSTDGTPYKHMVYYIILNQIL
jgi:hypothetical protein